MSGTMGRLFSTQRTGLDFISEEDRKEASAQLAAKRQHALAQALPEGAACKDCLGAVVQQLGKCDMGELGRLKELTGAKKQLAIYRCTTQMLLIISHSLSFL